MVDVGQAASLTAGTKTDGTLWVWGRNGWGGLGQNNRTDYSSPVQIPGTWLGQPGGGNKVAMMYKNA